MSQTPWWGLPLVAALFAVGGGLATQLVADRLARARRSRQEDSRWHADRLAAYVALLATFQRSVARLRRDFAEGRIPPDILRYLDEVGTPLMQVRLVASLPVRNAAMAVHRQLEGLHERRSAAPVKGNPDPEFLELLAHVPLVMQAFEAAIRDELAIDVRPRPAVAAPAPGVAARRRSLPDRLRGARPSAPNGGPGQRFPG